MYRFIFRLLDAQRNVLAWNVLHCEAKGDGALRASQDFLAQVQVTGTAVAVCAHWVDVHVYTTVPLPQPMQVVEGQVVTVPLKDQAILTFASDPEPLPGVTQTTSVSIAVKPYKG